MSSRCFVFVVLAPALLLGFAVPRAAAADLFEVFAETNDGGPPEAVGAGGSAVIDLIEDVARNRKDFESFANRGFEASLTFAGVENAMRFEFNQSETEATLEFPLTGFSRTFSGSDRDDLEAQITDFLKQNGAREYAKFQREIEKRSLVAVLDGNPSSSTALLSRQAFRRFGMGQIGPMWFEGPGVSWPSEHGRRWWLSINPMVDRIDADGFTGQQIGFDLGSGVWLTDDVGLTLSSVFTYRDIEGAETFQGGFELGLPVRLRERGALGNTGTSLGWQLTPFGSFGGAGSTDMASGGLVVGGGLTNQVQIGFEHFDLVAATQIAFYDGVRAKAGDYEFRPELDQQVLTNGLTARVPLDGDRKFTFESGASYTRYLSDAAVQGWVSPTVGLSYRTERNATIKFDYTADIGDNDYRSHNFQLGLNLQF